MRFGGVGVAVFGLAAFGIHGLLLGGNPEDMPTKLRVQESLLAAVQWQVLAVVEADHAAVRRPHDILLGQRLDIIVAVEEALEKPGRVKFNEGHVVVGRAAFR